MRDARNDDSRPEDDQAAIDRAFAELVADFHRSPNAANPNRAGSHGFDAAGADRDDSADPRPDDPAHGDAESGSAPTPQSHPKPAPPPFEYRFDLEPPSEPEERPEERYVPPPAPPLTRPTAPVFVGWLGIGYAIVAMFLLAFDVPLPQWAGWLAIVAFLGGLALLLSRLPRHRPPDDDDGARL